MNSNKNYELLRTRLELLSDEDLIEFYLIEGEEFLEEAKDIIREELDRRGIQENRVQAVLEEMKSETFDHSLSGEGYEGHHLNEDGEVEDEITDEPLKAEDFASIGLVLLGTYTSDDEAIITEQKLFSHKIEPVRNIVNDNIELFVHSDDFELSKKVLEGNLYIEELDNEDIQALNQAEAELGIDVEDKEESFEEDSDNIENEFYGSGKKRSFNDYVLPGIILILFIMIVSMALNNR